MKTKQIIQKALENMKIEASEFTLFVFEILLKKRKMKKSELVKLLEDQGFLKTNITQKLTGLNNQKVIEWKVSGGDATVCLTDKAYTEFGLACLLITGEKYGDKLEDLLTSGKKAVKNALDEALEKGEELNKKVRKYIPKLLRDLASKVEGKK